MNFKFLIKVTVDIMKILIPNLNYKVFQFKIQHLKN